MSRALENPWIIYTLLVFSAAAGALADVWVYEWARTSRTHWMVLGNALWIVSLIVFGLLLKYGDSRFGSMFMLVSLIHMVLVVAADILWYGTRPNWKECLGFALATAAILLLEMGKEESDDVRIPTSF